MNILVTGGAGYIGAHIVDSLCKSNFNVIVFDNLSLGSKENLNPKSKFIFGDLKNINEIDEVFLVNNIDVVIHLAAYKSSGESMSNTISYTNNNIIGSINLITSMIKNKVSKIIFSSTAAVYGESPIGIKFNENSSCSPKSHYGFTKKYIEDYLIWISKLENLKYISFRYFNAAGYTSNRQIISTKEKFAQNLLPIIMKVATNEKKTLEVYGDNYDTNDGTCIRDYVHVLDLADAHLKAIDYLDKGNSEIINLSTAKGYSVKEIISVSEKVINQKIPFIIKSKRNGDAAYLVSSFNKAKKIIGWEPKYSIEEIIESMWNLYNLKE